MTRFPKIDSSERASARLAPEHARHIEELGQIIAAYNEVTEKLQSSHDQLTRTVQSLRQELGEKSRLLERENRLAALGEMAAGMAHEIRNPLGGIQLYASLLAKDVADRPEALQRVTKISGGVKRLESLVGQVLQFTREITAAPEPIDLADVVEQAVEYASQVFAREQIECDVRGPRPMPASADQGLLGQAVLNLLLNAAEAIGEAARDKPKRSNDVPVGSARRTDVTCRLAPSPGTPGEGREAVLERERAIRGTPSLTLPRSTGGGDKAADAFLTVNRGPACEAWTTPAFGKTDGPCCLETSARRIIVTYGPPPGGSAARQFHLTVQDTGPGVPPAVMDRIFNPFFTTRDSGTGLGLSIVHRIVEAHDGTIHVTNPPDGGARFEIRV